MRRAVYAFIAITILAFAAGFPTYLAIGGGGGGGSGRTAAVTITAKPSHVIPPPPPPPPGGGGGGGEEAGCPGGGISTSGKITAAGLVTKTIVVTSLDERFRLIIDAGIVALTSAGSPLTCISILKTGNLPSPPEGAYLLGFVYDVIPDGATLSPPATVEYIIKPSAMPAAGGGQRLVIASYDKATGKWIELASVVDTEANIITAKISQLSDLAVFGYGVEVPSPAAFQVVSLSISPTQVESGEAVNITLLVTNTGGQPGRYLVILRINGVAEADKEIVLDGGASTEVSFTTSRKAAGSYSVDVNGLTGAFTVKPKPVPPPPAKPFNWWLIVGIIFAIALAAELFYVLRTQKAHGGITGALAAEAKMLALLPPKLAPKVVPAIRSLFSKISKIKIKKRKIIRGKIIRGKIKKR